MTKVQNIDGYNVATEDDFIVEIKKGGLIEIFLMDDDLFEGCFGVKIWNERKIPCFLCDSITSIGFALSCFTSSGDALNAASKIRSNAGGADVEKFAPIIVEI